jgi:signal transduction histidine kinase/HPt (histidine-containing phosphotransfer) domain-containing protein
MTAKILAERDEARQVFAGRIDVLYTMGRHYLSLPFAALCVPATLLAGNRLGFLSVTPLLLLMAVVIAAEQLTAAYRNRAEGSDPHFWARRYTFVSAIAGATWGLGSVFWFVWGSFPAQAYLALAYLGMTATEFIARSAYRPAYVAHSLLALGPMVAMLAMQGGLFPTLTAVLMAFFAAALMTYSGGMGKLIDESLSLRNQNADLIVNLQNEKAEAILARDSARASTMAKSAFIANISHELRTPMNALLGMAQLLERADLPKQQADHVKVMLEAGRGLQTLLDDVIALTRDDDDALEDEDCDPVQTARAVTRLLQPRAWEKRLKLTLTTGANLPRVAADPRRVRQAMLKLVDNALKFTERGRVDIRVELETGAAGTPPLVRFAIADTGPGVSPDAAQRLFKPFSPGDNSYARKEQGAGLGLAVTKRIVEQAGGQIGFESSPGDGAVFWFTLPVSGQAGMTVSPASPAENAGVAPQGLSLLISVTAPKIAASLGNMLEPFGNRIVIAASPAEAAAKASREHFDALLAGPDEADLLSAAPGVKAPIVAILMRGDRTPGAADSVLRWPVTGHALFSALDSVCMPREGADENGALPAAIDAVTFSSLEKSVGVKTLIEILQCYEATAEQLTNALASACAEEKWDEAARLAQDIVGAAGGLGLTAMTQAARHFAKANREGGDPHTLRNAAQMVVGEHIRARKALSNLYPDLH